LKPGTIFKWNRFPYPKYGGELKPRWFIYLGDTGLISTPIIAYICTTTTRGKKQLHHCLPLPRAKYPYFEEDCILDFDEEPYQEAKNALETNRDIETKGQLDHESLKAIYRGICTSKYYSKKLLLDIHTSFNQIGITGLKKP